MYSHPTSRSRCTSWFILCCVSVWRFFLTYPHTRSTCLIVNVPLCALQKLLCVFCKTGHQVSMSIFTKSHTLQNLHIINLDKNDTDTVSCCCSRDVKVTKLLLWLSLERKINLFGGKSSIFKLKCALKGKSFSYCERIPWKDLEEPWPDPTSKLTNSHLYSSLDTSELILRTSIVVKTSYLILLCHSPHCWPETIKISITVGPGDMFLHYIYFESVPHTHPHRPAAVNPHYCTKSSAKNSPRQMHYSLLPEWCLQKSPVLADLESCLAFFLKKNQTTFLCLF